MNSSPFQNSLASIVFKTLICFSVLDYVVFISIPEMLCRHFFHTGMQSHELWDQGSPEWTPEREMQSLVSIHYSLEQHSTVAIGNRLIPFVLSYLCRHVKNPALLGNAVPKRTAALNIYLNSEYRLDILNIHCGYTSHCKRLGTRRCCIQVTN